MRILQKLKHLFVDLDNSTSDEMLLSINEKWEVHLHTKGELEKLGMVIGAMAFHDERINAFLEAANFANDEMRAEAQVQKLWKWNTNLN